MEPCKPDRFNSETASLSRSDGTGENRLKKFLAWENRSVFVRAEYLSFQANTENKYIKPSSTNPNHNTVNLAL
jgi:hypothetical protein